MEEVRLWIPCRAARSKFEQYLFQALAKEVR
jgi:hypothetical protein